MECRPSHSAFRGILLLLLCALLATWVKPSRVISARNPQAIDLRPAPCMRQGCRQAANWKRARHSRRATKTCRNEDKQRQANTIGSRALCVPPRGCCVLSAPRLQVHSHRCPMHTHWLHVYRCSQTRLKAYGCPPARLQVRTCGCPQARLQVHRCQQTWLRACRWSQGRVQCNHAGTRRPGSKCKLASAYHRPGSRCAGASRLGSRYIRAVRIGSVCTYPPPVTRPSPWAQGILARLVIRSAGPVPSPG